MRRAVALCSLLFLLPATPAAAASPPTPAEARATTDRQVGFRPVTIPHPLGVAHRSVEALSTGVVAVPQDVAVVGVTWQKGSGTGARPQVRIERNGTWGSWQDVDVEDCTDCASPGTPARSGTAPVVVTGATRVEVRIMRDPGTAANAPRLSIIDGTAVVTPGTAADEPTALAPVAGGASGGFSVAGRPAPAGLPGPKIAMPVKRAQWRATENTMTRSVERLAPRGIVVHHTAGTNSYTAAQVPAILRGIQRFHAVDRGWSDIGYNALVDRFGRVWEGRRGGIGIPHRGAHAQGVNDVYLGVAYIGDTSDRPATQAGVDAITDLIAWTSARHGYDLRATTTVRGVRRPAFVGHYQVNSTSCPGTDLRARLPRMRSDATAQAAEYLRIARSNAGRR